MIGAILAVEEEMGLAKNGKLAWSIKEDMDFFRKITTGDGSNAIVMGRSTAESMPVFPLKRRENFIVTRNPKTEKHISLTKDSFEKLSKEYKEVWVIGGKQVYEYCFENKLVERILITRIPRSYDCDLFLDESYLTRNYILDFTYKLRDCDLSVETWKLKHI